MALTPEQRAKAEQFLQGSSSQKMTVGDFLHTQTKKPDVSDALTSSLKQRMASFGDTAKQTVAGTINPLQTGVRTVGSAIGAVGDVAQAGVTAGFRALPDVIEEPIRKGASAVAKSGVGQAVGAGAASVVGAYEDWKQKHPEAAKDLEGAGNILSILPAYKGAKVGATALEDAGKAALKTAEGVGDFAKKVPANLKEKAMSLISLEPDEKVKTILKETPVQKVNDYVAIAEKAAVDPRAATGFEKVGEMMSDALKQAKKQQSSLGKAKAEIINKAKVGLEEFEKPVRTAILEINRLKDPVGNKVIDILKNAKNKLQVDQAVDKIQDILYKGNADLTIPAGSSVDRRLKGIVGRLNDQLKESLPPAYRKLNDAFAEYADMTETLNRSLGEVVDGVPTRGASLVKQFFSPSGTKAKELFEFIKGKTGIDLAQDATLAKFTMELFDDPRARSLLQGIPTSMSGAVGKAVDFAAEKSGLLKGLQKASREETIKKAKKIAQ